MDPLERAELGSTGLEVTRVGLGCAGIGGLYSDIDDEQGRQVVATALDAGINFLDTAALYGAGTSERRVGLALADRDRDSYVLATKVGWRFDHVPGPSIFSQTFDNPGAWMVEQRADYSADWTERSIENSLKRLGVDRLDLVHIHDPDSPEDARAALAGAYVVLDRLRSEGVIGAVGAGMNQNEMLVHFAKEANFDCFLLAGRYSILEQTALDELLPLCQARGISIIAGGTYNSGILARGSSGAGGHYNYQAPPAAVVAKVQALEELASNHAVDLKAAASQFALAHPAITAIVPGTRRPERVLENLELCRVVIPAAFWSELRERGLVAATAPLPGGA